MNRPSDRNRSMPFYLIYPAHYKEEVQVNMPEDWPIKAFNDRVVCAGFRFTADGESIGKKVTLYYEYENLKDNVMPAEAANFFSNYDYAYKNTDYELYYSAAKTSSYNSSFANSLSAIGIFPKLYMTLGLCVLITILVRRGKSQNR